MPRYQLRFFIETPLRGDADVQFRHGEQAVSLLFVSGNNSSSGIEIELISDGANFQEAVTRASEEVIPPVLDAIVFHRKTPMLLGECRRILKSEAGLARRKLIAIDSESYAQESRFHQRWQEPIQRIIAANPEVRRLSLRWLRNSYRPLAIPEAFIYAWLALENLAGEVDRVSQCPECALTLECPNCSRPARAYHSANRTRAFEIMRESEPTLDEREFDSWWNRLRNSVFHGGREPDAAFYLELHEVASRIQSSVEQYLERRLGVEHRSHAALPVGPERRVKIWLFLEFNALNQEEEFASPVPQLSRILELMRVGRSTEEEMACLTLAENAFTGW